jgi:hypothetical protein
LRSIADRRAGSERNGSRRAPYLIGGQNLVGGVVPELGCRGFVQNGRRAEPDVGPGRYRIGKDVERPPERGCREAGKRA